MIMHVINHGDPDVGIYGMDEEVIFPDIYTEGYDEEQIKYIKEFLRELYDIVIGGVMTDDEYNSWVSFCNDPCMGE